MLNKKKKKKVQFLPGSLPACHCIVSDYHLKSTLVAIIISILLAPVYDSSVLCF